MRTRPLAVPLVVVTLLTAALAGCLAETSRGEPTISRVHTLTLSRDTMDRAERHEDDPMAALRELLSTDLVVRVRQEGDYTLEFTDAQGNPRTQTLAGATPAAPVVVSGADPLAPAVLKRGDETVTVRAGIAADWWRVGDMPLGFNLTGGSKTTYDFRGRAEETLTLADVDLGELDAAVQSLAFQLRVPMEGTASWELQPDTGDGSPVFLSGELRIPPGAGDLLSVELAATRNGEPGTAGIVAGLSEAHARASAKMWFRGGEPIAAQFLGGSAKVVPSTTMWADGFFAELAEGSSCAGATRAQACQPEELESWEESIPAGEKDTFDPSDYPRATTDEEREALTIIQRLFAQDIVPGDKATVVLRVDARDFGGPTPDGPQGDALVEFTIEAVSVEDVAVPAGTFPALMIVEEARTRVNIGNVPGPDGAVVVESYGLDETIARTTFWLDARTYQPLKMVATMPFDAEAILKDALNAIDDSAWDAIGGRPLEDRQWTLTAVAESSYEAVELQPGAHFSALVGLALAHAVTGTMGASPVTWWWAGFGSGFGEAMTEVPARPMPSLALASNGPSGEEGVAEYVVASASPGMSWGELHLTLDGMDAHLEAWNEECVAPEEGFTLCRGGHALSYHHLVEAGDVMALRAESGQTLRIIDPYSNSVILSMTVR